MKIYIGILLILLLFAKRSSEAKDIYVGAGEKFSSVKQAVNSSNNGDRVIVKGGVYFECDIEIEKSIELIGENKPVVDAQNKSEVITIKCDGVSIRGFIIKNSAFSSRIDYAAIRVESSTNCAIEDCELYDNFFSIYLANSSHIKLKNNIIRSNAKSESSSGNGIHAWKCHDISIVSNNISGNRDGIYFEFVTSSYIKGNTSTKNLRYGLHFMFSNSDTYENNIFTENGAGVAVMYTKDVKMIGNRFENNWGGNAYGLLLKEITDSYVKSNTFYKNTVGIYSEGGSRLKIESNNFIENGWANKVMGNCTDDTLIRNNYIGNTFDVATNSSRSVNLYLENYWDKYKGYDMDKDGIGDVPYRPVSLFSMMVESTPESVILLHSFVVDLLDLTEKVMPVFIPETLIDEHPKMEKWQ